MASAGSQTVAQLGTNVLARLQDPDAVFWNLNNEVYTAVVEAINDMMLLIGRPTIQYNNLITLEAGTVWQPMPANMLAITSLRGNNYSLWKTSLHTMDYVQSSWGPDWEADQADVPQRWGPLGLNYFFVHPAPITEIQMIASGVSFPVTDAWPPTGTEMSPFHTEFNQALELYAAAFCRLKELGDDAFEGVTLYKNYLALAQRLTTIEDRRDPIIFSQAFGTTTAPSQVTKR